jgi:hypothetical protein
LRHPFAKARSPKPRRSHATNVAGDIDSHVDRTKGHVHDALKQLGRLIVERLRQEWDARSLGKADVGSDTEKLVSTLISSAAGDDDFLVVPSFLGTELKRQFKESGYEMLVDLGLGDDIARTDYVDTRAVAYAESRGAELVGKRRLDSGEIIENPVKDWSIADATRDMLRTTVRAGVEEGWSSQRLADEIESSFAFSEARAETIARTELAFAATASHRDVAAETGAVAKRNLLGSEHDSDVPDGDECNDATEAGIIGINEELVPGYQNAPFHPRCVCDTEYIYADDPRAKDFSEEEVA